VKVSKLPPETAVQTRIATPSTSAGTDPPSQAGDSPSQAGDLAIPRQLGGYRIVRLIGRGAMGAVYEAKQLSLDRTVALKTILTRWADEPASLARFTREAYAAAQLTHHNVVQIYDFGTAAGKHFFSMEWVRGGSLSDHVRKHGALAPRVAAGYILQAARGLQFAHRNGMIHRDIKPANLLLSEDGVVKVADLGLVKLPDQSDAFTLADESPAISSFSGSMTEVTIAGSTVGTPAYMPPEQAFDAAGVDHRADIYALGCSLYHLLAGQPPFGGNDASLVIKQHLHDTPPPLLQWNPQIPDALVQITQRAMAKRVDDRYESISEMVDDLQNFLGLHSDQPFSPTASQIDRLQQAVAAFYQPPLEKLRTPLAVGWLVACLLLGCLLPWLNARGIVIAPLMMLGSLTSYFCAAGWFGDSPLYRQSKRWIAMFRWQAWLQGFVGTLVLVAAFLLTGTLGLAIFAAVLGLLVGAGFYVAVDKTLAKQQQPAIEQAEQMLRELRIAGVDESKLRAFVARYAGKHWETFFESVFGYQAMRELRRMLQMTGEIPLQTARWPWRDWAMQWMHRRIESAQRHRDQQRLAELEQQGLEAAGMQAAQAEAQAWRMAAALVEASRGGAANEVASRPGVSAIDNAAAARAAKRARMKAMLAEARSGVDQRQRQHFLKRWLGPTPRFLIGCLLLLGCLAWVHHNRLISAQAVGEFVTDLQDRAATEISNSIHTPDVIGDTPETQAETTPNMPDKTAADEPASELENEPIAAPAPPLRPLPIPWIGPWVSSYAAGVAGLLLIIAAGVSSWRMSLFAYPAAAIALCGAALGIPAVHVPMLGLLSPWLASAAMATILLLLGVFLSYDRAAEYDA